MTRALPARYLLRGLALRRPEFIARQSACPSGLLGRLVGSIMARETSQANGFAAALGATGFVDARSYKRQDGDAVLSLTVAIRASGGQ